MSDPKALADMLEEGRRLNEARTRDLGPWEYEPAPTDEYITVIHGRFQNGEPCGLGSMNLGTADQQNADAEFVCWSANNMSRLLEAASPSAGTGGESGWRSMESAPKDGTSILVFWPQHALDDDDNSTDEIVGGTVAISEWSGGWFEPDYISGHGLHMDDDWCYASEPTHWMPLPAAPGTEAPTPPDSSRVAALEGALAIAEAEERACETERNMRPRDSYHWGMWERARKSASVIAQGVRALLTQGEKG